jgi:urocanate hydratase
MDISPNIAEILKQQFSKPLQLDPLPELHPRLKHIPHAPKRNPNLTEDEQKLAIKNALRYFPSSLHK